MSGDIFNSVFGAAGITEIQIGGKKYAVAKPDTKSVLEGYGDTIKVGDVAYYECCQNDGKKWIDGPFRLDAISDRANDPWFRFIRPDGGMPMANYKGSGWSRTFKLADKETTDKLNAALKYHRLSVRLYVNFQNGIPDRPTLIPACWIAWVGNLQQAFREYHGPFGKLKKKNIIRWIKNGLFTDFTMKSKIPIPDDFPVKL